MPAYKVTLYDAFSETVFGGSIAAVVEGAQNLSTGQMQKTAREIGAPATGFIIGMSEVEISVRFFSPITEYPMCGHGTVALITRLVEARMLKISNSGRLSVRLRTPCGVSDIDVSLREDGRPEIMQTLSVATSQSCQIEVQELTASLGCSADAFVTRFPVELARSDFNHLLVPIKGLQFLADLTPDFDRIAAISRRIGVDTIALFTTETEDPKNTIHCREFCPAVGTPEAAASGTTNRALACYLVKHDIVDASADGQHKIFTEQGYEMGRPSHIHTKLTIQANAVTEVRVGGIATRTIEGTMTIP